jgi:GST-like protein
MLTLHTWDTPNGRKPLILLEELQLPYDIVAVDLKAGGQNDPALRALNPLCRIPVLVDEDIGPIFESNAILWHLATKTGQLLGEGRDSVRVMQWLFVQAAAADPALGHYFRLRHRIADPSPGELARQRGEALRVLTVLDGHLATSRYFAGSFSIADIAFIPQLRRELAEPEHAGAWPALRTWQERCLARPSVEKALIKRIA